MKRKILKMINERKYKVVKVTKTEFELENGDVYQHEFEFDEDITVEEFQMLLNSSKKLIVDLLKRIDE
ncbi:MAG: hypothetical protein ACOC2U_03730 [bacterium]